MTSDNLNDAIFEFFKKTVSDNETLKKKLWGFLEKDRRSDLDLNDWTYYFLQIQDGPKTITQIIDQMKTHGVTLPDENPTMVVSSKLRRDKRFSFSQERGWVIKSTNEGGEDADGSQDQTRDMPNGAEKMIAEEVYAELDSKSKTELGRYLDLGAKGVPYNVDVGLLSKFRKFYERFASIPEKELLRKAIRDESKKNRNREMY